MSNSFEESLNTAQEHNQMLRGVVSRVTYRNPSNGYCVLQVKSAEQHDPVTVVGNFIEPRIGANLVIRGQYKEHPRFGRQLSAVSITEVAPTSAEGIENYLSSGLIKGIGPKTARRLVAAFGEKTLQIIHREPEKVAKLSGVGRRKAEIIHKTFSEQRVTQEIIQFLVERGITPNLAHRIFDQYKQNTVEVVSKDPYLLARQLRGVGFLTADEIALNLGFEPASPQRLKAGIYYALERAADEGHCFLPDIELVKRAGALLGLEEQTDLRPHIAALIEERFLIQKKEKVYLTHLYRAEEFVAKFISSRLEPWPAPLLDERAVESCLHEAASSLGVTFSPEQKEAVRLALRHPILIVTGGPGCGKTTIIRALALVFARAKRRLVLAAPTGRAAQRMAQVCQQSASTIHRLLRFDPRRGSFLHGINDPLPADAVILDESSMIDILLAKDMFSAIPSDATLVLVGDKDQLPSVGPGKLFADLIALGKVPTIALTQLFRRGEESRVNVIAQMINAGVFPEIPEPDGVVKSDAYFIAKRDSEECAVLIEKLMADQIPRKFNIARESITVLTPSNRGPLGTIELNKRLQQRLNPAGLFDVEQELEHHGSIYRIGDRVCQRVNNYQIDTYGVYNGDLGVIHSVDRPSHSLVVELWDGRLIKYESGDIGQLSLAYAVTVHRSQGSEIPCVILALSDSHYMLLERQLLYTAVTRAKQLLIVVGSKRALAMASRRAPTKRRCTSLVEMIEDRHL
ncbi:MAG: ATP-dependent RecD-like DNA helicase [Deltaproteobacteria bacterium]|nr:ATP-dependent RecD-like DNA helicase [Deltaproteobacteria bacterium]